MKKVKKFQLKIVIFFSHEKSLYIAWACFRNVIACLEESKVAMISNVATIRIKILSSKQKWNISKISIQHTIKGAYGE